MLPQTVQLLIRYGRKPGTPVSVIRWGTTGEQKVVSGTLATIAQKVERAGLTAPALTIVGEVNRLRPQLNWFERKPLFGKTILITRSRKQASQLGEALEAEGARVLELPTIEITPIRDFRELDQAASRIKKYDWLVFTSENGVESFFNRLRHLKKDARMLSDTKIAAIGPGTKAKLNSYSIEPDLMPKTFTTEGLLRAFHKVKVKGKRFLLLRTNIAPDLLNKTLTSWGALVTEIPIYRTEKPKELPRRLHELIQHHPIDYITFTSSSTAEHFFEALRNGRHVPAKIISIGPVTSKTIRGFGATVHRQARIPSISGLVDAILKAELKST